MVKEERIIKQVKKQSIDVFVEDIESIFIAYGKKSVRKIFLKRLLMIVKEKGSEENSKLTESLKKKLSKGIKWQ